MNVENTTAKNTTFENTTAKNTTSNNTTSTNTTSNIPNIPTIKLNLQTIIKIFLQTYKINIEELF